MRPCRTANSYVRFRPIADISASARIARVKVATLIGVALAYSSNSLDARPPSSSPTLKVITESVPDGGCSYASDTMRWTVLRGAKVLWKDTYCSAYENGHAELHTDARGRHYLLLYWSQGRGNRNTMDFLTIYRLGGSWPHEQARLVLREPIGFEANLVRDVVVQRLPRSGLRVSTKARVDGKLRGDEKTPPLGNSVMDLNAGR